MQRIVDVVLAGPPGTDSGPSGADVAAWFALGVAALALAWNVYNAVQHRPHFHVLLSRNIYMGETTKIDYRVVVLNTGSEVGTVADIALEDRKAKQNILTGIGEQMNGRELNGPKLPARIEANDILVWTFDDEYTRYLGADSPVGASMSYYRPIRWWQRKTTFPLKVRRTRDAWPR